MFSLSKIINYIDSFCPDTIKISNNNTEIINCVIFTENTLVSDNTIYICFSSDLENMEQQISHGTFFIIEDKKFTDDLSLFSNVVIFNADTDKIELFNIINTYFFEESTYLKNCSEFTNLLLSGKKINEIIQFASKIFKNPMIILDSSYRVLSHSDFDENIDILWSENINRGYCTYDYIAGLNNIKEMRNSPDDSTPFCVPCWTSPVNRLVSKVYNDNNLYGYLVMLESKISFTNINMNLFEFLSNIIANKLKLLGINGYTNLDTALITELLNKQINSREMLECLSKGTSFVKYKNFRVICVDVIKFTEYHTTEDSLKNNLSRNIPNIFTIFYDKHIVIIVNEDDNIFENDKYLSELNIFLEKSKLEIGISSSFNDLMKLNDYYNEAKNSIYFSKYLGNKNNHSFYDDYKFYDLICHTNEKLDLTRFCDKKMLDIYRYDKANETTYLKTLYEFIINNKSPLKTSKTLFMHKNTIIYRINKIKELFNINLDDHSIEFKINYSYTILNYIDKIESSKKNVL